MGHVANCTFRQNQAKSADSAAMSRVARAVQPQQRKRKTAFHSVRRFPIGNGKDSEVRRTAAKKAADVVTGNGVFEIGRGGQRLDRFVGELPRQEMAEAIAKSFARRIALGAFELEANKFEAVGLGAAESLDGKREALVGMIGDGKNAPRQIVIL
jgi:hypothetical protein